MENDMPKHVCKSIVPGLLGVLMILGSAYAQAPVPDLRYGSWGLDLTAADPSIRPGDDFFRSVNGTWLKQTAIPSDKSRITLRTKMTDVTELRLRTLLEAAAQQAGHAPGDINGKVGAFYKAFMNENAIEALGATPVTPMLTAIRTATTREALGAMMGRAASDFIGGFFSVGISEDVRDPSHYSVYLNQGGLGLSDRDYYLSTDPEFVAVKAAYQSYIEKLLGLAGWPDPAGNAARIVAMEARIAAAHWSKDEARDLDKTYNPMTVAELEGLAPGFPWRAFLADAKLASATRVIVGEISAFPKIADVFATTPVDTLRAWHAFNVVSQAAPYLSKPFADAQFEMYRKTLLGQEQQQARWKRGIVAVSGDLDGNADPLGHMGWAVGQLYVERHFSAAMKQQAETIIGDLVRAFRTRLATRDWIGATTKAEALTKLDAFVIQVGYPSKPQRDYTGLVVTDDDAVGNVRRAAALDWNFYVNRLPNPVDRNDWYFKPQVNNAANSFSLRNLVFPAALLQAPMYDPDADPAVNYGAFGAYAGHEITHGFDDQGRKIDAKGGLRDWWTIKEAETFGARAAELGKQYSAFEPLPGLHVNGKLTMGENIADLGGVTVALDAYRASLQGKPAPVIDGLTGDQRVFLGWAQAWRGKLSDSALRNQITTDPHSPRPYRVNGVVRNIDEWYAAFGVTPADKLYVAPENRVRIW
jgi:putative endopeptidase